MLQHVSLEVRPDQVRDCVAFWELLGFTEIEPPASLRRFTWVERDGTHIHLIPRDDPAIPVEGHAAVVAPDGDTIARLREHGFERMELRAATGNLASQRVAEKAGFVREGVARNAGRVHAGRVDLVVYSLTRADLGLEQRPGQSAAATG